MATTIGGVAVIAAAAWIAVMRGGVDVRNGLLFATGLTLVASGMLSRARQRQEAADAPHAALPAAPRTPLRERITIVHVLCAISILEVAINRVVVPMTRPPAGSPPAWHTLLDYAGLFLFYFVGVLGVIVIALRCYQAIQTKLGTRELVAYAVAVLATVLAAVPLVVAAPAVLSLALELAFAITVVAFAVATIGRDRDLGVQVGLGVLAIPLLVHTAGVLGGRFVWPDNTFDGPGIALARAGVVALALAALVSPYCFAPRPFARTVTRPGPMILAMAVAALGAVLARTSYPGLAKAALLAIGVELSDVQADPRLALYLLAIATLVWTLASCAWAPSPARRQVGLGLAFVLLGGYGFHWPHHFVLPMLGVMLMSEAARRVREDELATLPLAAETPPISDPTWAAYVASVTQGLKRTLGEVHSLTTRGEGGLMSSLIVGEAEGLQLRTRIERIDGCVLALDVVIGREIDELRGATLTVWAIAPRALGANPPGPPASPLFKTGDAAFDERFKTRGSALALTQLLPEELRTRAATTLDGWLAYWEGEGLRYRVYPGRGAPLDHPMPLSDLALGRSGNAADRLVVVIELLVEIARRGVTVKPAEPTELEIPA